ncbi:MAG: hypothetical protein LBT01_01060 [Spirochaetaceae bacterium]|jgi:hypothetical protein|nr:hypothetical protein [Spirochaetaceae bacterium]
MKTYSVILICILCVTACSYSEPSSISFTDIEGNVQTLFAHSKKAQSGSIDLDTNGKYEFELATPLAIPENTSLLIEYTLVGTKPLSIGDEVQCVISFVEGARFMLPLDFAYLGIDKTPEHIAYAIPASGKTIQTISLQCAVQAKNKTGAALHITNMLLAERTFGYRMSEERLSLSPFVYQDERDGKRVIIIDPPPEYAPAGSLNLQLENVSARAAFTTSGKRYEYMQDNQHINKSITIPECIINRKPYPILFEGVAGAFYLLPAPERQFPADPIPADPGIILSAPQSAWRDERYEVYCWDIFPSILIFDTADYLVQDRMLKRLAFFAEKKGFRGKIVSDADMEGQHGWNAHDYRAETLAAFFNAAHKINFPLSVEERELETILLANGILHQDDATALYEGGGGAIISISREIAPIELRQRLMVHECYHGIFFLDEEFRAFSEQRLAKLDRQAKIFLQSYLDYSAYDTQDKYLYVNEFMAYILQQPAGAAAEYFGKYWPQKLENHEWRFRALPKKDERTENWPILAEAFDREANAFSAYVQKRWGLSAGRLWRIKPRY